MRAPAPMTLPFPIVTPSRTMTPAPIQVSSPTRMPPLADEAWNMIGRDVSATG